MLRLPCLLVFSGATSCTDDVASGPLPPAAAAAAIEVTPGMVSMAALGETSQLTARVFDARGREITSALVSWLSDEPTVATVDDGGLLTAIGNGQATVTAASGSVSGHAEVTVYDHRTAPADDRDVLMILYEATRGDRWRNRSNENWGSDEPLATWSGVSTDNDGRVTGLDLMANGLNGPFPPELGRLSRLRTLNLRSNPALQCPMPPEVGDLHDLEHLNLRATMLLNCPLPPELGRLTKLKTLNLLNAGWRVPLPPELGNLSSLTSLVLGVDVLERPMPAWIGNLSSLEVLDIFGSAMTGPIPPSLGNLGNLRELILEDLVLDDSLPAEIGNLANLEVMTFYNAGLRGSLPRELGNLGRLEHLSLQRNSLTGEISARTWLNSAIFRT